jgi:hypothetical protein
VNSDLKARWLTALRSGQYQQARGRLRYDDRYCCLGVLCDISGQGSWSKSEYGAWLYSLPGGPTYGEVLPNGLDDDVESQEGQLSGMNDLGQPFSIIADWIEHNL